MRADNDNPAPCARPQRGQPAVASLLAAELQIFSRILSGRGHSQAAWLVDCARWELLPADRWQREAKPEIGNADGDVPLR